MLFFCCCFCWNELNCLLQSFSKLHKTLQWGPLLENLVLLIFKVFWYYWFLNWDFSFCLFFFLFFFLVFFFALHVLHYIRWVWMDGILYWELFLQERHPAVLRFFSLVEKIKSHEKKKQGEERGFGIKSVSFFGNDILLHSDFWFQINCFNELVRPKRVQNDLC